MIHLSPDEKILMVLHRHWIVILGKFVLGVILLLLPSIAMPVLIYFVPQIASFSPYIDLLIVIYLMVVVAIMFMFWMDYYLDVWIITSERIVDIEQKGLFNREISEFMLDKVQDITVEIPDIMATFLKYGNIIIQTAGERSFAIRQVPNIYEAKNIILDQARKQNVGTQ